MSLKYKKSAVQEKAEYLLESSFGCPYHLIRESDLKNLPVNAFFIQEIKSVLELDIKNLYFNGLFSILDALKGISLRKFSWPTVKLYYSCFYLLKCALFCNDVILIRRNRDVFYLELLAGKKFVKIPSTHKSDHQSSIWLFNHLYGGSDILLSNEINEKNSYEWIRKKREEINYRHDKFQEPETPYFWKEIQESISKSTLEKALMKFLSDEDYIFTFQEEYAILAVPLKRLKLSYQVIVNKEIYSPLDSKQKPLIKRMINEMKVLKAFRSFLEKKNA